MRSTRYAASVPEVTDPLVVEGEIALAVLSAVAHGNGPNGLAVVEVVRPEPFEAIPVRVGVLLGEDEDEEEPASE